jgi:hypothetical protein
VPDTCSCGSDAARHARHRPAHWSAPAPVEALIPPKSGHLARTLPARVGMAPQRDRVRMRP